MHNLINEVQKVIAVQAKSGYEIFAVMADGSQELLKKTNMKPVMANLWSRKINGNAKAGTAGEFFDYRKSVPKKEQNWYSQTMLKSFIVEY